jgi:hypothetical protein
MAFSVNEFRSAMTLDGARPNLFEVELKSPTATGEDSYKMRFMAKAAQLPGSTIGMVNVSYFGRELKFPGNRTFPDWTVTIINDEDFKLRDMMERWMNSINGHSTNERTVGFVTPGLGGYSVDARVKQYGKDGLTIRGASSGEGVIKEYIFKGLFPIDVSPIELDWGTNDSIEEFTVTFAYQWWESNTTT